MKQILVTNNDWQTKNVAIKNKTHYTLKNGKKIPTWQNQLRKIKTI